MRSPAYIQGFYDKIADEQYRGNRRDSTTMPIDAKTKAVQGTFRDHIRPVESSQPPGAAIGGDTDPKGNTSGEDRTIQTYNSVAPAIGRGDP